MRIGIDARFYGTIGKGLGRYTSELLRQLELLDTENDYIVFLREENFNDYVPKNPRFSKAVAEFPWYGWREQLIFPFWLRKQRLDLVHFCHFNVPMLYGGTFVVTIHDLILLAHPTLRASTLGPVRYAIKYLLYRLVIGSAVRKAEAVLTVSECTKKDILSVFPEASRKPVVVTPLACAPSFRNATNAKGDSPFPSPYLLYVGNAYPHKNLERLLAAFAGFRKEGFTEYSLALAGADDYFSERLRREAASQGTDANVIFAGRVTEEKLASAYDHAAFYVFPSLHEGFGLPPLEAMCRGIPVASSNASCLPETLGDAALYFDPEDVPAMTKALRRLATDEDLRKKLVERGKKRSSGFDWKRCAEATLATYKRFGRDG